MTEKGRQLPQADRPRMSACRDWTTQSGHSGFGQSLLLSADLGRIGAFVQCLTVRNIAGDQELGFARVSAWGSSEASCAGVTYFIAERCCYQAEWLKRSTAN